MDGSGRHEHRDLESTPVLDAREQPAPEIIDATEPDDEGEPSFF
ncbi:MAG: hypothetical protein ACT4PN_10720 [Nitrospiraceae bacterium]